MIRKVVYNDGSIDIDIDNTELLRKRVDIDIMDSKSGEKVGDEFKARGFKGHRGGLGGLEGGEEEKRLKEDLKRTGWSEPDVKSLEVYHICPICGTKFKGRTNRVYCCTRCKKTAEVRRYRKRKRDIRDFKPHRGHAGEVYIMCDVKGKDVISFVPAFYADTRARTKKYLEDTYPADKVDDYYEQAKEVVKK